MDDTLQKLSQFQPRLLMAIHGISAVDLSRIEREGAWSIREVIAHLGDVELMTALRIRLMLVHDNPELPALARNEWVSRLHGSETAAELLEQFWELRRRNLTRLRSLSPEEASRTGVHATQGQMSIGELAAMVADHQERHLGQIERVKAALGLRASQSIDVSGVEAAQAEGTPVRSAGPGIRIRDLWSRGARRAQQIEIDAGAVWPSIDYHVPGPEEVYVVAGEFGDGQSHYEAGTFLHHPAGSSHLGQSRSGCVLFVYYPEG